MGKPTGKRDTRTIVVGPDGKRFAFPASMPREEMRARMRAAYAEETRIAQEKVKRAGIDREATAAGRAEGERAASRMGVDTPFEMAMAAPAIGMAQQSGGRPVYDREGIVLPDEAAGMSALNSAGFFIPGMVNQRFGERLEEGRRQEPGFALAGDVAGGMIPGELIGQGIAQVGKMIAPQFARLGSMLKGAPETPAPQQSTYYHGSPGKIEGELRPSSDGLFGPGVYLTPDKSRAGAYAGNTGEVAEAAVSGKLATYDQWKKATKSASQGVRPGPNARAEIERKAIADLEAQGFVGVQASDTTTVWNPANLSRAPSEDPALTAMLVKRDRRKKGRD